MPEATPGATDTEARDVCTGRGSANGDHCCYVDNETCRYLLDHGPDAEGRRFECSLRKELGSWEAVHEHPGYQEHVQPAWDQVGIESCGAWQPRQGECCREAR